MITLTPIELIALSAAVWYISFVISSSKGPWSVFELIRLYFPMGGLVACIICLSIWVAFVLVLVTGHTVLDAFALAGVALWIHAYSNWVHIH